MNPRPAEVPGLWVEAGFAPDGDALFAYRGAGKGTAEKYWAPGWMFMRMKIFLRTRGRKKICFVN